MSKITNDRLIRSGTGCIIAVLIWQQWVSEGKCRYIVPPGTCGWFVPKRVSVYSDSSAPSCQQLLFSQGRSRSRTCVADLSPVLLPSTTTKTVGRRGLQ